MDVNLKMVVMVFVIVQEGIILLIHQQKQRYKMKFVILKEFKDGYLIMAPNGDTQYITEHIYKVLKMKNKI